MRQFRTISITLITSLALSACGGNPPVDGGDAQNIPVDNRLDSIEFNEQLEDSVSATGLLGDDSSSISDLDSDLNSDLNSGETNQLLETRVIHFEYDSSVLTSEGEAVVHAHAQYLVNSGTVGLILEGHADARGTREYNLALGESRAKSVAQVMQALGVSAERIQTISYGEERPIAVQSDENAWGSNRRVEILYQ